MNDTDWPTYLAALSTNQSEIARVAGVATATVSRWFSRSTQPLAPQVIAVARAYDQSPVVALVAAGYLTRDEVEREVTLTPGMSLAEFSELEIAQELVRRIEAGETTETSEAPLEVDHPAWANVGGAAEDERTSRLREEQSYLRLILIPGERDGEVRVRDENDVEYPDLETAWQDFRGELAKSGLSLEKLQHAAKSDALEVEEDTHTP